MASAITENCKVAHWIYGVCTHQPQQLPRKVQIVLFFYTQIEQYLNVDNHVSKRGFYDSICTCKKCDHKMSKYCFEFSCKCSVILDGIEGFESNIKKAE
jgi:hypothetical protein